MGKKNDYSKVFGGGKSNYDVKVKKHKSSNHDIFFNDVSKKKKKKKKKDIDKVIKGAIGSSDDDDILSEFIIWDEVTKENIPNFTVLSETARGLFVVKLNLNGSDKVLVPVTITNEGKVLHTETGDLIEKVFAVYAAGNTDITDVDIQTAADAIYNAHVIEAVYNIDTTKLMENIRLFSSENIEDEED